MQRVKCAKDYIPLHLQVGGCAPNDVDVLTHLNLQSRPIMSEHDWVDAKVVGISSALSTETAIDVDDIVVRDSWNGWLLWWQGKNDMQLFWQVYDPILWMLIHKNMTSISLFWIWGSHLEILKSCSFLTSYGVRGIYKGISTMCRA